MTNTEPSYRPRAIRVDTLRNQIAATIELLTMAGAELEDLHTLGYIRHTGEKAERQGTRTDYSLDNNGDPKARDAYRALGDAVARTCELLAEAAHDSRRILATGGFRLPRHRQIDLDEFSELLAAQERRIVLGDAYTPVRALPQPEHDRAISGLTKLSKRLDNERTRLEQLARWAITHRGDDEDVPDVHTRTMRDLLPDLVPRRHRRRGWHT